ncbi:MMPL family transporter [Streptoverticillium reticulum]|uniref:MMPL family transporter n=1 Tax=Streptoverticillium reticulum TaxID=1433415 RepID=UPI0039BFB8CF
MAWLRARKSRWCLPTWAALALAACLAVPAGLGRLGGTALELPGSSSARAAALVARGMPQLGTEQLVLAFNSPSLHSDEEPYRDAVAATARAVAATPGVGRVLTVPDVPQLDPHHTYLLFGARGDAAARQRLLPVWRTAADRAAGTASDGRVTVALTGATPLLAALRDADLRDLRYVEALTVPAALLLLVVGLGSVGSALVPVLAAGLGVLVSAASLIALTLLIPVDSMALTVATTVGFGLGLDYTLLLLLHYRRHREQGLAPCAAGDHAAATAGRAVLWCAAAVGVTSAALLTVPLGIVRTMGLAAGISTVVATAVATTALPAALPRLDRWLAWGRVRRERPRHGRWERWADRLMRRPWPYLLGAVAVLALAAMPAGQLRPGLRVDRTAIARTAAGAGFTRLERDGLADVTVFALPHPAGADPVDTTALVDALRADPRISTVGALDNGRDLTVVTVADRLPVDSPASRRLVRGMRSLAPRTLPPGQPVFTGGPAATLADFLGAVRALLWQVGALALAGSLLVMLVAFRSLLVPLKALVMNALSTAAAFGLLAWVTRHTADTVNLGVPLLALTIVFGLSLDYEIFLVHRITDHYRADGDCRRAVASGLGETARPITLAAATMAVVFAGLMATHRQDFRQAGFLVATAVLLDVTLIRLVVVPTLMRLLGHRNWWLPRPLHRLLPPLTTATGLPPQRPAPPVPTAATSSVHPQGDPA